MSQRMIEISSLYGPPFSLRFSVEPINIETGILYKRQFNYNVCHPAYDGIYTPYENAR
jgi:hypothetical protein